MPLLIILFFASNKRVTEKMAFWEKSYKKEMKLASGIVVIILAIILWVFSG